MPVPTFKRRKSQQPDPAQIVAQQICQLRFPNYDPDDDTERAKKWIAKLQSYQNRKSQLNYADLVNEMVHETAAITTEIAVKSPERESSRSRGASVDWPDEWDYDYTENWIRECQCLGKSR